MTLASGGSLILGARPLAKLALTPTGRATKATPSTSDSIGPAISARATPSATLYVREAATPPPSRSAGIVMRTYRNPVFAHDAPDPTIIVGPDGLYHLYSTQSEYGSWVNIPMLTSPDLVHWRFAGDALPRLPSWSEGQSWAPEIDRVAGGYRLYFATQMRTGDFAIAMATSSSLFGPFVDIGRPVVSGHGIDALDPFVLHMPSGRRILYWGSGGAPIQAAWLSADGASIVSSPTPLLFADPSGRTPYERLIEGAWILPHGGWYYLMYSGDRCCLAAAHYAVMVARSRSPFGPFVRDPNNPILASNSTFHAPGHNATIEDAAGQDWMIYHAMQPGDNQDRVLMLDPLEWTSAGWPLVDEGRGPSAWRMPAPIIGH